MNKLNKEKIIKSIKELIEGVKKYGFDYTVEEAVVIDKNEYNAIIGLLNLYEQEKNKNIELQKELNSYKEQLAMFIPRRRVRRVYKMLGKILQTDIAPKILEKELKEDKNG